MKDRGEEQQGPDKVRKQNPSRLGRQSRLPILWFRTEEIKAEQPTARLAFGSSDIKELASLLCTRVAHVVV